jgi:ribose transport system substrate-binding protein
MGSIGHPRRFGRRAAAGILVAAFAAAMVPGAAMAQSPAAFTPERQSGIPGALRPDELQLWQWDPSTSAYTVVEGDASAQYVPNLDRTVEPGTRIGYAEGWAAIPFSAVINKGIYRIAGDLGADVAYCDIAFDSDKAVSCAELIAQQSPAFVVNSNWRAPAAQAVMAIYDAAGIPTLSIDVVHPNAIFIGADSYTSGDIAGRAAGEYAASLGRCGDVTILLGEAPGDGDAANQRLAGFADGVQVVCGALPADRIKRELFDAGTTEQALTKSTDWLTANPGASFVLGTSIDDARADGIAKALVQSGREGVAVAQGCDDIGIAATKAGPPAETRFLGCVPFYPERYPDYAMSVALDVLEGKAVPQEVHIAHEFLDRDTIGSVYP